MIDIQSVTVLRGEKRALDDVSLRFGQGGITALIGPNGAGKSTLLHAMSGLLAPSSGRVTVGGRDMGTAHPRERARMVAMLTQTENVTARLTVNELVGFGRWPHHHGRPGAADRAMVAEALALFSLEDLAERRIDTLSGGQRQRAFVAMAFAQETPWMLLDEPLSALDPRHARDLMERLHDLTRPGGPERSVVIVLHDLSAAARYADRVVALQDGQVVRTGPASIAMTGGMLSDLYGTALSVETVRGRRLVAPA